MKKLALVLAASLLSTAAFALEYVNLDPGQSVVIGNYQVSCGGGSGNPGGGDYLSRQIYPNGQVSCQYAAQLINGSQNLNQAYLSASCSGMYLYVRVMNLWVGGQASFRTRVIPMDQARELNSILNSMSSGTMTSTANIQTDNTNWNFGLVNYTIRHY